ncbi:MAG TPA: 23S rRNA (pseudouridine(1915)-N(3))-methyltransferase RlmH [Rhizomicrobium sp.]|nr:23S rRNA (pseudouridine(1915)-N(3))-methyltransferase RlmH [Rhizomicrobium sp.]
MRILILAVGHMRASPEGVLTKDFLDRARKLGRNLGIAGVTLEEMAVSKLREPKRRKQEEAELLSQRIPGGAEVALLDAAGQAVTSQAFAEWIGALRDRGAKHLVFVIGGPDGLVAPPGVRAGRSLAFGPQTWPHLLARAMLAEQIYRGMTILAGHPYHRA